MCVCVVETLWPISPQPIEVMKDGEEGIGSTLAGGSGGEKEHRVQIIIQIISSQS